jgi:hypothetical protein
MSRLQVSVRRHASCARSGPPLNKARRRILTTTPGETFDRAIDFFQSTPTAGTGLALGIGSSVLDLDSDHLRSDDHPAQRVGPMSI